MTSFYRRVWANDVVDELFHRPHECSKAQGIKPHCICPTRASKVPSWTPGNFTFQTRWMGGVLTSAALVPDALTTFAFVHAHAAPGARIEDRLNDTDDCAAAPAVWLNRSRSRLSLCCVHEHLEYRSSRLSVSPWNVGVIVTLGADERETGGGA